MPLLARMVGTPLVVEVGSGAVAALAPLLADRRISSGGHVAVAVGPGQGAEIAQVLRPQLANADITLVQDGSVEEASGLAKKLRAGFYDAIVGIGGGRVLDVAKYAASISGLPMVAVATSLAHDGLASPVASLTEGGRKMSFGVTMPLAVVVDLDYVRRSAPQMRRSGIGDAVSNLSAIADWELAHRVTGEAIDGLAVSFARAGAMAVIDRTDTIDDDAFLISLADALVLGGLAMAVAGSSRPCSGADHEILHAIDHLFPGTASHGELAGLSALFVTHLRGDAETAAHLAHCLVRHGLPMLPADVGLSDEQFAAAVSHAPATRPDRFTLLEHLALSEQEVRARVEAYVDALDR